MKKRILGVIAFAAVAIAAGWNYQQSKQDVELSDLAMENVEALAGGESLADAISDNCNWCWDDDCEVKLGNIVYNNTNMKNKN